MRKYDSDLSKASAEDRAIFDAVFVFDLVSRPFLFGKDGMDKRVLPLERQTIETIQAHAMFTGGETVLVAVSGGIDDRKF